MKNLINLILWKVALGVLTLFAVSLIIFTGVQMLPGDFATEILGQAATAEAVAAIRESLGLDLPAHQRYFAWVGDLLTGDFGTAFSSGRDVAELIGPRLWNTVFLAGLTAMIAVPVALALGLICAVYRDSWFDRAVNFVTLASISFPEFFVAYVLMLWLAVNAGLLPVLSDVDINSTLSERIYLSILPALTLTLGVLAHMVRMTKISLVSLLENEYIETARLKGNSELRVLARHALPNAWAPVANVVALNLAYLITGVVVVEAVFVYPGMGQLMVDAVQVRDIPVVQSCALIFAVAYVLVNLAADVISTATNPRLLHPK
ncbi:ABC transporter permease [Xinfangfangia sp. CPCC 101601]|uniref:ABC transporter permease n=1 Tax=Pseudogemmobacter lacusdianii TaxID=3069608 RepID=A0ABU0W1U4_9RHOB|nr:ABC transporter permease [Xinfangfangia sp. CPCC 101601]MDQ2067738.1 ABC transporter permease [Xinfangfangia sp. CPCC 101601]